MGNNSKIEWTTHTFNPWWGCMKVSEGCKNCYAETLDNRWNKNDPHWGPNTPRKPMSEKHWQEPFKWDSEAKKAGVKAKVFCASMADVFEDHPDLDFWRARLFTIIENTPNLIWQLLTKRPENIIPMTSVWTRTGWPENVWMGTSVENQIAANKRIPELLQTGARVKFLSCEPLLGPLDLTDIGMPHHALGIGCHNPLTGANDLYETFISEWKINWIIVGGESGHNARELRPSWIRSIRDQCKKANVPFFFKQWGEYIYGEARPYGTYVKRVGKKEAGSILDGKEYREFPIIK